MAGNALAFNATIAAFAGAVLLAACTTGAPQHEALNRVGLSINDARTECERRREAGVLRDQVERANCINQAETTFAGSSFRYPDLMAQWQAKRLELAVRTDAGEITDAQAEVEYARTFADIQTEAARRGRESQVADANRVQALAALAASRGPYILPPPVHSEISRSTLANCTTSAVGNTLQTYCY